MSRDEADLLFMQFMQICRECDIVKAEKYLDDGLVDVNGCDTDGNTPLQYAAAYGHSDLVEVLITRGADSEISNMYGFTPLLHASYNGHAETVALLIKFGAKIHVANVFGATGLTLAAKTGSLDVVKLLLDNGIAVEPSFYDFEPSPLMIAAQNDHETVVKFLIENGADIGKVIESTGFTALMFAALNSQLTMVQLLLDRGADPDTKNILHQSALSLAVCRRRNDVKALLEQYTTESRSRTNTMLVQQRPKLNIIDAVKTEDTCRIKEILNKDPLMSNFVRPEDGCTPLMLASMLGRLDIVTLLVKKGAMLDKQDKLKGWTALMQATFFSKVAVAKFLIHSGANVGVRTYDGFTALELAAIADYTDICDDGLLALLSRKEQTANEAAGRKSVFGGFFSKRFARFGRAKRSVSKPKEWWNRFKSRFRRRSNSVGNSFNIGSRRNIPLGHESCLFIDPTKSVLNSNLIFGPTRDVWKSQSVCDLHSLRNTLPRMPDPIWGLTTRNYDYLEGKPGVVVPPFHPIMTFGPMDPKTKRRRPSIVVGDERRQSTFLTNSFNSLDWNFVNKVKPRDGAILSLEEYENVQTKHEEEEKTAEEEETSPVVASDACFIPSDSSFGGYRSLAMYNANRMRPPKFKPLEPISFQKYEDFIASLNMQPTTLNVKSSLIPSPNSSMSAGSTNFPLQQPPMRKRTPYFAPAAGAAKKKNSRGLMRPHSYHDAVSETRSCGVLMQGMGVRRGAYSGRANTSATLNRPHSYHDPEGQANFVGGVSFNDLPITPTRKTSGFFNNSVAPYRISKFSSTPHLTTSPSNSTSDSSSITPNKRSSQMVNNSSLATVSANFNSSDTLKLDEDYMDYILKQIAAEPYSDVFDEEELDLDTFVTLNDGDLRDLGIQDPGPRNEILKIVRQVNYMIQMKRKRRQAAENELQIQTG